MKMKPIKKQNKRNYQPIGTPFRSYAKMKITKQKLKDQGKRVKHLKTENGEFQLYIKNIDLVDIRNHNQNTKGFREQRTDRIQ